MWAQKLCSPLSRIVAQVTRYNLTTTCLFKVGLLYSQRLKDAQTQRFSLITCSSNSIPVDSH